MSPSRLRMNADIHAIRDGEVEENSKMGKEEQLISDCAADGEAPAHASSHLLIEDPIASSVGNLQYRYNSQHSS